MVPLSDLSALCKQINEANQTLRDFETKLLALNIGVPANALISRIDVPMSFVQGMFPGTSSRRGFWNQQYVEGSIGVFAKVKEYTATI